MEEVRARLPDSQQFPWSGTSRAVVEAQLWGVMGQSFLCLCMEVVRGLLPCCCLSCRVSCMACMQKRGLLCALPSAVAVLLGSSYLITL